LGMWKQKKGFLGRTTTVQTGWAKIAVNGGMCRVRYGEFKVDRKHTNAILVVLWHTAGILVPVKRGAAQTPRRHKERAVYRGR